MQPFWTEQVGLGRGIEVLLERLGPQKVLTDAAMARVDTGVPLQLLRETYHGARAGHMLNRMLAVDMRFILADRDLPKVTGACGLAGMGHRAGPPAPATHPEQAAPP